jgi:hypothetical protein
VVTNMQERLKVGDDGKALKFHDTLVENMRDLLDRVPALNLTGDPEITTMTNAMRELVAYDANTLREDFSVRSEVSAKAALLAKQMACFV